MKINYSNTWRGFEEPKVLFNELLKSFKETNKRFNISTVWGNINSAIQPGYINIHLAGEPFKLDDSTSSKKFDIILSSDFSDNRIISFPFFLHWLYWDDAKKIERLYVTPTRTKENIPKKFCCFLVSNPRCKTRNTFFMALNKIKRVDSWGHMMNNCGAVCPHGHATEEFINFISEYKFIICFENSKKGTYITEKIINPFLAHIIPIYWGTEYVFEIFNKDAFLYLDNNGTNNNNMSELIKKILEIDANDDMYLNIVNQPRFVNKDKFLEEYSLESMEKKIAKRIRDLDK